jgi:NAD/NADP transhydrogenase beta subunit
LASAAAAYLWFLAAVSALDGALRMGRTRQIALLQSERLAEPKTRRRRTWIGLATVALSPFMLLYGLWHPIPHWMWISVVYGIIAGLEYLTSVQFSAYPQLVWHTRIFGVLSAAMAVTVYFGFLRR